MKTNKLIQFVFLALLFTMMSCDDAIDIKQPGRLDADAAFKDVSDLQLGLLGAYRRIDLTNEIELSSTFTDEISIGFDNGGQGLGDGRYGFILNSTSLAPTSLWVANYGIINSATRIIEASTAIEVESDEMEQFNSIVGQARAIRAFAHFQLFSYFTTDYTNDGAMCCIGVDFIPVVDQELPRNTNGEIIALINADLDAAFPLLPATSDPTFINKDFVTALRARMAAYRGQYAQALGFANELLGKYPLADQTQYVDLWADLDNTEVIFKLERSVGDSYDNQGTSGGGWAGSLYAFVNATLAGSPYFEMGRAVFNGFAPGDIRATAFLDPSSLIDPDYATNPNFVNDDILVVSKYPGSDGQPLMNDLKVFRSSEMLFIAAEAQAAAGNLSGAAALLKQLRDARLGQDTPALTFANETEAFGAILDERRIELVFEGHRYKDLKRLGVRGNRSVDRDPLDCAINGACSLPSTDHRFTLPIPQVETNANAVIREQQNPGY